jgi:hypothetical protein
MVAASPFGRNLRADGHGSRHPAPPPGAHQTLWKLLSTSPAMTTMTMTTSAIVRARSRESLVEGMTRLCRTDEPAVKRRSPRQAGQTP